MSNVACLQKTSLTSLRDPRLFREYAYVNGAWTAGSARDFIDVTNPADGSRIGAVTPIWS